MAEYILVLDGAYFEEQIRPALGEAWRRRSFEPCRALCQSLVPAAADFARRYHTGEDELFVARVAAGLPFDRAFWRMLTGEVLLVGATEVPEFQTCPETLCRLLSPGCDPNLPRRQLPLILQAHHGSRDLSFGTVVYRPEHAGYNNVADVARLAEYLTAVRPEAWTREGLHGLEGADDEESRAEELAFAREWFPALCDLYQQANARGRLVILESVW
jgi:hypothetical protein